MQSRIVIKTCKLRCIKVNVLEEAVEELGSSRVLRWHIKECMHKADKCRSLDCLYCIDAIGGCGSKDPFGNNS